MSAAIKHSHDFGIDGSMKKPLIASGVFHLAIVILCIVGLPVIAKKPPVMMITPISISFADIAEETQTNVVAPTPIDPDPKPEADPAPTKPVESAPKVTSEAPPDVLNNTAEPAKIEDTPVPPPTPAEPILEAKKDIPKPAAKPKIEPKPKKAPPPKPKEDAFQSLLKNIAPDAGVNNVEPAEDAPQETAEPSPAQIAMLGDKMTSSEIDAIRYQLEPCWSIPAGAKYAEDLAVEIRVGLSSDGRVIKTQLLDQGRYKRDNAYRAAADSAMRALRNPRCAPLKLPADKYAQWQSIVINFDPQMLL